MGRYPGDGVAMWNAYVDRGWYLNPIAGGASTFPYGGWVTHRSHIDRMRVVSSDGKVLPVQRSNYEVYREGRKVGWDEIPLSEVQ